LKNKAFVLLVAIVLVTLVVMMGCGSGTTTPTTTTPTTTTPTTTTPTTTTPTTTPTTTTPTTTTPTTTGPVVPLLMISLGHDFYSAAPIPVCLLCHDLGKPDALPDDHGGGLPPLLTANLCLTCHQLGTITETPTTKTEEIVGGEFTEVIGRAVLETHPIEGFEDCALCHLASGVGSPLQKEESHACDQCHETEPQPDRKLVECQHIHPIVDTCATCHQPAE